ncbi:hypothetical protein GVX82_05255 [Patescibacteria group bacterium]|nr:hypothetical protein [Patescibacteria group bacterium]
MTDTRVGRICPGGTYDRFLSAAIQIRNSAGNDNTRLFMANTYVSPGPGDAAGVSSANTMGGLYAESVTFDTLQGNSAIEVKAHDLQLSRVSISGPLDRPIRVMRRGVKYFADVDIQKPSSGGWNPLVQVKYCRGTTLKIYNSSFNGSPHLERGDVHCWGADRGAWEDLNIEYLDVDPRTTGEMHPMFRGDC